MEGGTTITPLNATTLDGASPEETIDPVQAEMGAIIGVIFGVLFGVALIGFAGFMYIKQKRKRQYTRKTKVKMTPSRNAGVYIDTTVEEELVRNDDFTFTSPDYKAVQQFKSPYENDSDEELLTDRLLD